MANSQATVDFWIASSASNSSCWALPLPMKMPVVVPPAAAMVFMSVSFEPTMPTANVGICAFCQASSAKLAMLEMFVSHSVGSPSVTRTTTTFSLPPVCAA
jgi:hypothetical protein